MTLEEEHAQLRAENAELRTLVAQLQEQLAAALERIADLNSSRARRPLPKPRRRSGSVSPAGTVPLRIIARAPARSQPAL